MVSTASSRFTASSSSSGLGRRRLRGDQCSAVRAISLISGNPYEPPEPASRWKPVLKRGQHASRPSTERLDVGPQLREDAWAARRDTLAAARGRRRRGRRSWAPEPLEGQPRAGHERRRRCSSGPAPRCPFREARIALRSSTTRMIGMPGQPRPSVVTTSTGTNPSSTGPVEARAERHPGGIRAPQRRRQEGIGVGRRQQAHRRRWRERHRG